MKKIFILSGFLMFLSIINLFAQCDPNDIEDLYTFSDVAPAASDCSVGVVSAYSVYSSEAYALTGVVSGETYLVDLCDASVWDAVIGIYDETGSLVASDDGTVSNCGMGAQLSFTANSSGTYTITVGSSTCEVIQDLNGFITVFNNSDNVTPCPPSGFCQSNPVWAEIIEGVASADPVFYCGDILGVTTTEPTVFIAFTTSSQDESYNITTTGGTLLGNDGTTPSSVVNNGFFHFLALTQDEWNAANGSIDITFEGTTLPNCGGSLTLDLASSGLSSIASFCECSAEGVWVAFTPNGPSLTSDPEIFCDAEVLGAPAGVPTLYIPVSVVSNDGNNVFDVTSSVGTMTDITGLSTVSTVQAANVVYLAIEEQDILASNGSISIYFYLNDDCNDEVLLEMDENDLLDALTACGVPTNDDCAAAIALNIGDNLGFNNIGATVETDDPLPDDCWTEPSGFDKLNNTVWFTFEGDGQGYMFETIVPDDEFDLNIDDTQMQIYTGSCGNFVSVEGSCSDDIFPGYSYLSRSFVNTQAGETYYILVDGFNGKQIDNFGIRVSEAAEVSVNVLLQGNYDPAIGAMTNGLQQDFLLPMGQPYYDTPWEHFENVFVADSLSFPDNTVDWILVEMRSGTPAASGSTPGTVFVEAHAGLLLTDGSIVDSYGNPLRFGYLNAGEDYHILVRHRNHLDIISSETVTAGNAITYDFTTAQSQAFGNSQQVLTSDGKAVMYGGDYVPDGIIQNSDNDAWKETPAILSTYNILDGTLDGIVQLTDQDVWFPNKAKIGTIDIRF